MNAKCASSDMVSAMKTLETALPVLDGVKFLGIIIAPPDGDTSKAKFVVLSKEGQVCASPGCKEPAEVAFVNVDLRGLPE